MKRPTAKLNRKAIRLRLKAVACEILAAQHAPLSRRIQARVADEDHAVLVILAPVGQDAVIEEPVRSPTALFAPLEAAIVGALNHTDWVICKIIGARTQTAEGPHLTYTLVNLALRNVVQKNPAGQGYRLHPDFRANTHDVPRPT